MNTPGGSTLVPPSTRWHDVGVEPQRVGACTSLKAGAWDRKKYTGNQLNNKVLGVIGLGRIGMAVVKVAASSICG